jgi:copper chaperone CopZ
MPAPLRTVLAASALLSAGAAVAAERTVTLDIENVGCAICAPIVKRTLSRMPGVSRVVIAERAGSATAIVTFDDARVTPNAPHRRHDERRLPVAGAGELIAVKDQTLIKTGIVGSLIVMLCCATPVLVLALGAIGLSAWAAKADYVVIPVLFACVALATFGFYRKRRAEACARPPTMKNTP